MLKQSELTARNACRESGQIFMKVLKTYLEITAHYASNDVKIFLESLLKEFRIMRERFISE